MNPPASVHPENREEWHYIVKERLGLSCGENMPTREQLARALAEATEHCTKLQDIEQPTLL